MTGDREGGVGVPCFPPALLILVFFNPFPMYVALKKKRSFTKKEVAPQLIPLVKTRGKAVRSTSPSSVTMTPSPAASRSLAPDGRQYFSYAQIAATISSTVPAVRDFRPDLIIAIGGGGYIPARMLRTEV